MRNGNRTLFYECKDRIRRFVEMGWDYVFEGLGDTGYSVCAGGVFDIKTMWAECEVLVGTMLTLEYTGDAFAQVVCWQTESSGLLLNPYKGGIETLIAHLQASPRLKTEPLPRGQSNLSEHLNAQK